MSAGFRNTSWGRTNSSRSSRILPAPFVPTAQGTGWRGRPPREEVQVAEPGGVPATHLVEVDTERAVRKVEAVWSSDARPAMNVTGRPVWRHHTGMPMDSESGRLVAAMEAAHGPIVVLTGAGISFASGIATFRGSDPGAIWARDITELATLRYFTSDPVGAWRWYRERFLRVLAAHPNPAHHALAALERWHARRRRDFLLVTQNIDTLHERAGSTRMVKVHGSADRCRCADPACRLGSIESIPLADLDFAEFDRAPGVRAIPSCPACGTPVRPHVLWFDELYVSHADYQWHVVDRAAARMALLICVGTSLAVGVTSFLQSAAADRAAPAFLIDPGERPRDAIRSMVHVRARAEELLPEVNALLTSLSWRSLDDV